MKDTSNLIVIESNNLITRWWDRNNKTIYSQRKRLPNNVPTFTKKVQKEYLKSTIKAVKFIREESNNLTIGDCLKVLNEMRGEDKLK